MSPSSSWPPSSSLLLSFSLSIHLFIQHLTQMALLLLVYQRGKWALITLSTTGQWWESIPDPKCCIDGTRIFTATSFITAKAWAQHQLPSLTECSYDYRCEWYKQTFKIYSRDFPSCPVVKICLPMQGTWTQSRVGELRSHMPRGNWARMPQWIPSTAKKKKKKGSILKKKKKTYFKIQ